MLAAEQLPGAALELDKRTLRFSMKNSLDRGGAVVWGIVPTGFEAYAKESLGFLVKKLEAIWQHLCRKDIDLQQLLSRSLLSPATCCLVNPDGGQTVAGAFAMVNSLSRQLREKYRLS